MISITKRIIAIAALILSIAASCVQANVILHAMFSNDMVIQRDMNAHVWGTAEPGESVTVCFRGKTASTVADTNGSWLVNIPTGTAGGPFELKVVAKNTITLENVMTGDVWVCGGQSNMLWWVGVCKDPEREIAAADYPNIRLFTVPRRPSAVKQENISGRWTPCTPDTIGNFSAVGYFFGRELHKDVGVPIGLISVNVGGTNIETWIPEEAFHSCDILRDAYATYFSDENDMPAVMRRYRKQLTDWEEAMNSADRRNIGLPCGWANPDCNTSDWEKPARYTYDFIGAMWYRTEVDIPKSWLGKPLELHLGCIDDYDTAYVNGLEVGSTTKTTVRYWMSERKYLVHPNFVRAGKNVITVRVFNNNQAGGFVAEGATIQIAGDTKNKPITLNTGWISKPGIKYKPSNAHLIQPLPPGRQGDINYPCTLYNAMIHPIRLFNIKGAIWYQGESNVPNAWTYRTLFPTMIEGWRNAWNQGNFPFYYVQLANYMAVKPEPGDSRWAELREAQTMTLRTPNTGQAVIIDIGDEKDIHPKNKQDVGLRLARIALAKDYSRNVVYSGPMYNSMKIEGSTIRLSFDHTGSGLMVKGDTLKGFAIAGADNKYVWAEARIDGRTIVVSSPVIAKPLHVRYAWADNPVCNLYNQENLPACPFRTDASQFSPAALRENQLQNNIRPTK